MAAKDGDPVKDKHASSMADFFVENIPGMNAGDAPTMYAGHIPINETTHANMFFWYVDAQQPLPKRKMVSHQETRTSISSSNHTQQQLIWLTGGPGCSSLSSFFLEHGPFRFLPDQPPVHPRSAHNVTKMTVQKNPHAWNRKIGIMYVDQPVGTGYSIVKPYRWETDLAGVTRGFLEFLDKVLGAEEGKGEGFVPVGKNTEIYLGGDSFAGTYIPHFAKAIIERNEDPKTEKNKKFNLGGAIIQSGWMDPKRQYESIVEFSSKNNMLAEPYLSYAKDDLAQCLNSLKAYKEPQIRTQVCERVIDSVLDYSKMENKPCVNVYDVRLRDAPGSYGGCGLLTWPPGLKELQIFLNNKNIREAVHAPAETVLGAWHLKGGRHASIFDGGWEECSGVIADSLRGGKAGGEEGLPGVDLLPFVLERIPVVLYGGDKGILCNHMGVEWMISNMTWNGEKGMGETSKLMNWVYNGTAVGTYQTSRNLTQIVVFGASHLPNVDKPELTLDLFERFMGVNDNNRAQVIPIFKGPPLNKPPEKWAGEKAGVPSANEQVEAVQPQKGVGLLPSFFVILAVCAIGVAGLVWFRGRRGNRFRKVGGRSGGDREGRASGFSEFGEGGRNGQWHELADFDDDDEDGEDGHAAGHGSVAVHDDDEDGNERRGVRKSVGGH
ncbi:Cell death protease [Phlyctochytrium planicorne]|nr:Cell death protease [Phlyctochytrium planicorne]